MTRTLIVSLLFLSAFAQHDHTLHIDSKFVHGEALRSAWLDKYELSDNIKEFVETLQHLNEQYETIIENPPADADISALHELWIEKYQPSYRKSTDYLHVASHVCHDIYEKEKKCDIPENIWNNKCDGRGETFIDEFEEEIGKAIEGVVAQVKMARNQSNERREADL